MDRLGSQIPGHILTHRVLGGFLLAHIIICVCHSVLFPTVENISTPLFSGGARNAMGHGSDPKIHKYIAGQMPGC